MIKRLLKWTKYIYGGFFALLIIAGLISAISNIGKSPEVKPVEEKKDTQTTQVADNQVVEQKTTIEPADYSIVEKKDISIINCTRVTYRIKVADDAKSEAVDLTQQKIIDENKSSWNDITVWTYKNSDSDEYVKKSMYTVDMAEYSTCKL